METAAFLSVPLVALILLAGIFGYFGNHILTRGIIFIDIALAQVAALGTMIGILLGFAEESFSIQAVAMIFTLLVVSFFALTKFEKQRIPQEAIIGIIYGLSLGIATLFAEYIPGGSNYITKTITGNILWCTWGHIKSCFIIFAVIGVIHALLSNYFIKISESKCGLPYSYGKMRLLEVVFYVTFGIVVVRAVPIAGVFLVFTLLIAPAAIASLFARSWKYRFIWSWIIGIIGSVAGMAISYNMDISNGPAIVCLLGLLVFVLTFGKIVFSKSENPQTADN